MYAHLCADADEERTDVEGGTRLVWRDESLVEAYHLVNHFIELLGGELWHEDATAGGLQTGCIFVAAEHAHLTVRTAVGFQSLEGFLSIVQTSGCHVHGDCLFGANFYFAPLAVTVVTAYIVVGLAIAKADT